MIYQRDILWFNLFIYLNTHRTKGALQGGVSLQMSDSGFSEFFVIRDGDDVVGKVVPVHDGFW